jgi:para-nitrobenzyl esterase
MNMNFLFRKAIGLADRARRPPSAGAFTPHAGGRIAAIPLFPTLVLCGVAACTTVPPTVQRDAQALALTEVVPTTSGPIQGLKTSGMDEFLGIPYAAPPVGNGRWRPPQPVPEASQVLQATKFASTCAQSPRGAFASPSITEDCLYLNVFTPRPGPAVSVKRPVMVWLHGGGLFSGESNDYDAGKLVRRGGVVVVTLNYRVGALGFFSQPAVNAEGHPYANYGIMDQQFALQWVRRNIANFGGDPGNVTIFGQSGGATSVIANLASPTAAGLFQRAISQSGTRVSPYPQQVALDAGKELAAAAGCPDQSAQCLRALSVEQILRHQARIAGFLGTHYPVVDGTIITHTAAQAFGSGQFNHVPVMNGLVQDEQAFFMPEMNSGVALTAAGYDSFVLSFSKRNAAAIAAQYPMASYASPSLAEIGVSQDLKVCTARYLDRTWAKYVPVYAYQFNDRTAPSYFQQVSYPMRAYHTAELQYLFPLFHGGQGTPHALNAAQEQLSNHMVDYWTSFAGGGVPTAPGTPASAWPRYSTTPDDVQYFDLPTIRTADAYGDAHHCGLWDPIITGQ